MASMRGYVALAAIALACFAACGQPASHAKATKPPLIDLLDPDAIETVAETRRISFGLGDRSHLIDGWSKDEMDTTRDVPFVWATSLDADLSFELLDVTDQQFLVNLSAFPTKQPQRVTVLVNGHQVSTFTAQPLYLEYRFVAHANVLKRGQNRLTFRHTELGQAPAHLETSRRFAAAYNSILMGPQCLPMRANGPPVQPTVERQRRPPSGSSASLLVVGPAALRRRVDLPADAVLRYRMSLPKKAPAGARSTIRVHDAGTTTEMVAHIDRPWFGGTSTREVEMDLTPWSGKTVDIEIEVGPDLCRAPVASALIDQADIAAKGDPDRS